MTKENSQNLRGIFTTFFKLGTLAIGGGFTLIPLIKKEIVDKNEWVSSKEMVDIFALSQSTPGILAVNSSIFIGYKLRGALGSLVALLGVILPSILVMSTFFFVLSFTKNNIHIEKILNGVKTGVAALVTVAAIKLGKLSIKNKFSVIVFLISFFCLLIFKVRIIILILIGAISGYLYKNIKMRCKNN